MLNLFGLLRSSTTTEPLEHAIENRHSWMLTREKSALSTHRFDDAASLITVPHVALSKLVSAYASLIEQFPAASQREFSLPQAAIARFRATTLAR